MATNNEILDAAAKNAFYIFTLESKLSDIAKICSKYNDLIELECPHNHMMAEDMLSELNDCLED